MKLYTNCHTVLSTKVSIKDLLPRIYSNNIERISITDSNNNPVEFTVDISKRVKSFKGCAQLQHEDLNPYFLSYDIQSNDELNVCVKYTNYPDYNLTIPKLTRMVKFNAPICTYIEIPNAPSEFSVIINGQRNNTRSVNKRLEIKDLNLLDSHRIVFREFSEFQDSKYLHPCDVYVVFDTEIDGELSVNCDWNNVLLHNDTYKYAYA